MKRQFQSISRLIFSLSSLTSISKEIKPDGGEHKLTQSRSWVRGERGNFLLLAFYAFWVLEIVCAGVLVCMNVGVRVCIRECVCRRVCCFASTLVSNHVQVCVVACLLCCVCERVCLSMWVCVSACSVCVQCVCAVCVCAFVCFMANSDFLFAIKVSGREFFNSWEGRKKFLIQLQEFLKGLEIFCPD